MKKTSMFFILPFVIFFGCSKQGKIVAKIGSDKIDTKMLRERIQETPQGYQEYLNTAAGKKQFVNLLVRERIVIEAAKKAGVNKKDEYKKVIAEFKKDQERRSRDYEENLLMELFVRELHEKEIGSNEAEVEQYYNVHKEEFVNPVALMAQHILVQTEEEAEAALERVKSGENFGKVAKEISKDPVSAVRGGEIGPFKRGDLVPEFENVVFELKMGAISEVVKTPFGYHVIKKKSVKKLPALSYEEAKVEIKKILEKTKFDTWLENAKKKFGVKIDYSLLSGIASENLENSEKQSETVSEQEN